MLDAANRPGRALRRSVACLGLVSGLGAGCGASNPAPKAPPAVAAEPAPPPESPAQRAMRDAESDWAQREDPAALARAIQGFEEAAELSPSASAWARLAQAQHFAARVSQTGGEHAAAVEQHAAGLTAAARALPQGRIDSADWAGLPPDRAAALYWYARHLHNQARLQGLEARFVAREPVVSALLQVADSAPAIDQSGADRTLGELFAEPLSPVRRDPARARKHFDAASRRAPHALETPLRVAATLAVQTQDRELFERSLQTVLGGTATGNTAAAPEDRLAQREAEALLARAGELFE